MKILIYISPLIAVLISACTSTRQLSHVVEDDIYYIPGERSLFAREVERKTGLTIQADRVTTTTPEKASTSYKDYPKERDYSENPISYKIGMNRYGSDTTKSSSGITEISREEENSARNGIVERVVTDPEYDEGYWLNGFDGSSSDLKICEQIIHRYPEGFAAFGNAEEIARNLTFSSDWNIFTYKGRYWWFPTPSNYNLYHELVFGTYPKYVWTVIWNDIRFDTFAAQDFFDPFYGIGSYWNYHYLWGNGFYNGYYSGFYWRHSPWNYGYGFYNPWWGWDYGWYGYYGYYPPFGGYYPYWHNGYHRPGWGHSHGNIVVNTKPEKYVPRTKYTTNRNARTYNSYSNVNRYRTVRNNNTNNNTYNRTNERSNYHPSYSSGSYSRGSSSNSSYGRSSGTHTGSGAKSSGRVNTGRRD